jgi:hypothetical protein
LHREWRKGEWHGICLGIIKKKVSYGSRRKHHCIKYDLRWHSGSSLGSINSTAEIAARSEYSCGERRISSWRAWGGANAWVNLPGHESSVHKPCPCRCHGTGQIHQSKIQMQTFRRNWGIYTIVSTRIRGYSLICNKYAS